MEKSPVPWFRAAVLLTELLLVSAAVIFPLVITGDVLTGFLRILELVAQLH